MMIGESAPAPDAIPGEAIEGEAPAPRPLPAVPVAPEFGGRDGLDPVRYGDWEKNGRCIDF
jgi:hypothetical protein